MEYTLKDGDTFAIGVRRFRVNGDKLTLESVSDQDSRIETVIDAVIDYYNTSLDKVMSDGRTQHEAEARMTLYWFLRNRCYLPYQRIGSITNRRHCTVLAGVRKFDSLINWDRDITMAKVLIGSKLDSLGVR